MALGSNNPFPSALFVEGTTPSSPSAGNQRLFVRSSDHVICLVNSSGVVTPYSTLADPMTTRGDIIVRNAANATARLAVGATATVLASDGTDVSWGGGTYAAWTPALTAATTNPTLGTASAVAGRYTQIGKHVSAYGSIIFGSSGVNAGSGEYHISLPVTSTSTSPRVYGLVVVYDDSAGLFRIAAGYHSSTTVVRIAIGVTAGQLTASEAVPWSWAANDGLIFQLDYEAA